MPNSRLVDRPAQPAATAHFERVASHGSLSHCYVAALPLASGSDATRNLADAVHLLCHLHGRHPGLLDIALQAAPAGETRDWLGEAAASFERERLYLVRLTASVGPLPSTPGAAETEATLIAQRHALETLARSERNGCAVGASVALVADWRTIRPLLDRAATRLSLELPAMVLPDDDSVGRIIDHAAGEGPAVERAISFGAEQLLLQHRGLFDLLEARAGAREGS